MKKILVPLLSMSLLSGGVAVANPRDETTRLETMTHRYNDLFAQDLGREEVEAVMSREFGLRFLASPKPEAVSIDGNPNGEMVIMEQPTLAGEESDTGNLHMFATMRWRHDCKEGKRNVPCWQNDERQHGGPDGLAVRVTRKIVRQQSLLTLRDNCGNYSHVKNPSSAASDYGVGYIAQDRSYQEPARPEVAEDCLAGYGGGRYRQNAYNWDFATIAATFRWQTECRNEEVAIDSSYGHSWDRTTLTGIGIYANGFSFSWQNGQQHFNVIPNPPGSWKC